MVSALNIPIPALGCSQVADCALMANWAISVKQSVNM